MTSDYWDESDDEWCRNMIEDENYWGESDDDWCRDMELPEPKRARVEEQEGAGVAEPLFKFSLRSGSLPRRWKNVANKTRHTARLEQLREADENDRLGVEMTEAVRRALLSAIETQSDLRDDDRIHFTMQSTAFAQGNNNCFQSTQFQVKEIQENGERLETYLQQLARQLNSSQSFTPGDDFLLDVTTIRMPGNGGVRKKYQLAKATVRGILKKSQVRINNTGDDMCCARAIVTMRAYADEKAGEFPLSSYDSLRRGLPCQKHQAQELLTKAGLTTGPCGLEELAKLQSVLQGYQIKVLKVGLPHMIVFSGPEANRLILLLLEDEHYDGCTSYGAWLAKNHYCHDCDQGYDHEDLAHHLCNGKCCKSCFSRECEDYLELKRQLCEGQSLQPTVKCDLCNRMFMGQQCLTRHSTQTGREPSTCKTCQKCTTCCKLLEVKYTKNGKPKGPRHKCGWTECGVCDKRVDIQMHQCFIQPIPESDDEPRVKKVPQQNVGCRVTLSDVKDGFVQVEKEPPLFVYADYEAITDAEGIQTPILIGYETAESDTCHLHYGDNCTSNFIQDMEALAVDEDGDDRDVIIIFHNLKGYDGMFLLQYMYENHREVERLVTVGVKVLSFASDRLTFKDSLCFLPFALSSFPATFGIRELSKGFFPHLFNTLENQSYRGPMPEVRYYDPDGMSPKKKEEFMRWHATKLVEGYEFDLRRDMQMYCESDVKLLKAGCTKFVEEFKTEASFNPMEKCITIASACNRYWRKCHLEAKIVAVQPLNGWKGSQTKQSFKARRWLAWNNSRLRQNDTERDRIRFVDNGGEVRVAGSLVDGFDETTQTVYEFNGCFFHGCLRCYPKQRNSVSRLRGDRSFHECYDATQKKKQTLVEAGYQVITEWECEWDREVKDNPDLQVFLDQHPLVEPLQPRDAFFGGRTNAVRLHHCVTNEHETIKYQDVTSLYPWVNKYATYPVSHPNIITGVIHVDISQYFGLAKVTISPPFGLFHPVLPWRSGGKLTFPLCRTCVEIEMKKPLMDRRHICTHSESQRELTGTWCTPELEEAVAQGYRITKIHEVWHFPPNQRRQRLFAPYVDTLLRIKTEASGYPNWVRSPEDKHLYRQNYSQREGIALNESMIEKNPGRKATAKLMLNSFWGKFGENLRKSSTANVTTPAELYTILCDPLKNVTSIRICSEEVLEVLYTSPDDECVENGKTNLFVAAFTTCHARLKLYSYLKLLDRQVLYFDTDSVIYSHKPGQTELDNGDYLGDLTNELDPGDHIVDFTSGGPKNYGYITSQGKVECKVRGFTLGNVRGSRQLNYTILRQNVLDELTDPGETRRVVDVTNPHFFTRHPATKELRVIPRTKQYGLVFDKRVVDTETFCSYPYGYRRHQPS